MHTNGYRNHHAHIVAVAVLLDVRNAILNVLSRHVERSVLRLLSRDRNHILHLPGLVLLHARYNTLDIVADVLKRTLDRRLHKTNARLWISVALSLTLNKRSLPALSRPSQSDDSHCQSRFPIYLISVLSPNLYDGSFEPFRSATFTGAERNGSVSFV